MQGDNPISWLMFFTLAATTFIIAGSFIYFLRSRTNREIASEALEGNGSRVGATPNGAGAELIGIRGDCSRRDGPVDNGLCQQVDRRDSRCSHACRSDNRNVARHGTAGGIVQSAEDLPAGESRAGHALITDVIRYRCWQ